ncbi:MAG: phytase [Spirochaetaceae bacterium]|nr:phytase [Spirochaetaceae bacterium]MCF7947321.1 phytase [Spirochaetia bacterium]MCF7950547.1 phytase [Spirochaetaceae bacterium]
MRNVFLLLIGVSLMGLVFGCAGGPAPGAPGASPNIRTTVEKTPYVENRTDNFVHPVVTTESTGEGITGDADDPAIWVHPETPSRSVIFGVDKAVGIYAWDLDGKELLCKNIHGKPGNIDVRYGLKLGDREVDIVAVNIRRADYTRISKVAVYEINPDYSSGEDLLVKLADGESENNVVEFESYGFGLYKSKNDGNIYAFTAPKRDGNITQYMVEDDGSGKAVRLTAVRVLNFDSPSAKEGMVCDDEAGYLYVGEEPKGVHKYYAEPDADPNPILSFASNKDGYSADREGVSIYRLEGGEGYLVVVDQGGTVANAASMLRIYDLNEPHELVRTVAHLNEEGKSIWDDDGVEVSSKALPGFPHGVVIAHDGNNGNYPVYDWVDIAGGELKLANQQVVE